MLVAFVIVAQVGYGFVNPVIDQWAHGAGLVSGCVLALALSPHARWAPVGRQLARVLAVLGVSVVVLSVAVVTRTSVDDSFARLPGIRHTVSGVQIDAPAYWRNSGTELSEPDGLVIINVGRVPAVSPQQLFAWQGTVAASVVKNHELATAVPALRRIAVPLDWQGGELLGSYTDATGATQNVRVLAYGKVVNGELFTMTTLAPDSMVLAAPAYFARLYSSARLPEAAKLPPGAH